MTNNIFKPVVTTRASDTIYMQIREKITQGELKQGDILPGERDLIEIFNRSRPTIREAMRMLEAVELLEYRKLNAISAAAWAAERVSDEQLNEFRPKSLTSYMEQLISIYANRINTSAS